MKCLLIRHGETQSNLVKVYAGWNDEPLTERGVQQACEVSKLLATREIDVIYTGRLRRVVQSAEIIAQQIWAAVVQ